MKILVCGKGGCGKSTLAAFLAYGFVAAGRRALLIDTDESNRGLHRLVGLDAPSDIMEHLGGKKAVVDQLRSKGDESSIRALGNGLMLKTIPDEYVSQSDGIRMVSIGKVHEFGEGCACPMGMLARTFIEGLALDDDEVAIVDTEAGIEHFGRGVARGVDAIIMVIDPSHESVLLAKQVATMVRNDTQKLFFVLNKVEDATRSLVFRELPDKACIVGELPHDPDIMMTGLEGKTLSKGHPVTASIVQRLLDEVTG
jgi:CO dehydrogenase maturation factor